MNQKMHLDFWPGCWCCWAGSNDQHQCCSAPATFSSWYKWLLSDNEHHQNTESNSMALKKEAANTSRQNKLYSYMVQKHIN